MVSRPLITSRQNPLLKELQSIRDNHDSPLLFLEGPRLIEEALKAGRQLELLVIAEQFPHVSFLDPLKEKSKQVYRVSDSVYDVVSDVDHPQGLLAVCRRPQWDWGDLFKSAPAPIVILDGLQDPGNAASIIRTAEAAGAAGIISTPSTARLFSPKALRGAMGSSLRMPILEHRPVEQVASQMKKAGYQLLGAVIPKKAEKGALYTEVDWTQPQAVVLGQEAKGVSSAWNALLQQRLILPMRSPVESLNVGAAAAVWLYESARQRRLFDRR